MPLSIYIDEDVLYFDGFVKDLYVENKDKPTSKLKKILNLDIVNINSAVYDLGEDKRAGAIFVYLDYEVSS
jgi:hypothetical protein